MLLHPEMALPLRPIRTKPLDGGATGDEGLPATTPTAEDARIPEKLPCPPAPKKRKPPQRCQMGDTEFFRPPELETVFVRRRETAE
ncbi:unnamed protein product [Spirodela intermedia]|uniref:Uncharacterized protein n=1 Tax=Spirodela intermedia TaxID=51605 RepID=A0A7I8JMU8_SPIIN|nr:unnamed protein product [Spirodela intermedia]CAA6671468.1 unnamed protein product [Spirodela intermedia]